MKKIAWIIILCMTLSPLCSFAEENEHIKQTLLQYEIIDENMLSVASVNRGECITAILKVIGTTKGMESNYKSRNYDQPVFNDVSVETKNCGYIYIARLKKLAFGKGGGNFYPDDPANYKEAVAFIMRCLETSSQEVNETFSRAKEIGFIKPTDNFYDKEDESLLSSDFCTLLYRMLYEKRYKYMAWQGWDDCRCLVDEAGSMRYIDYLDEIRALKEE